MSAPVAVKVAINFPLGERQILESMTRDITGDKTVRSR